MSNEEERELEELFRAEQELDAAMAFYQRAQDTMNRARDEVLAAAHQVRRAADKVLARRLKTTT